MSMNGGDNEGDKKKEKTCERSPKIDEEPNSFCFPNREKRDAPGRPISNLIPIYCNSIVTRGASLAITCAK